MELDQRKINIVKKLAKELAGEVLNLPAHRAADRMEFISIILEQLGLEEAAEYARQASCRFGEGEVATRDLLKITPPSKSSRHNAASASSRPPCR